MKVAEIWVKHIIMGNKKYNEVPTKLKEIVKSMLIEKGRKDLVD